MARHRSRTARWLVPLLLALIVLAAIAFWPKPGAHDAPSPTASACIAEPRLAKPGETVCGLGLDAEARITYRGNPISDPWIVTYDSSGAGNVPARAMVVFPPAERFALLAGCEGDDPQAICWSLRLVDLVAGKVRPVSSASHYGPKRWISWAPDGNRLALIDDLEGDQVVTIMEGASGAIELHRPENGMTVWRIDEKSFAWDAADRFHVTVTPCKRSEDPAQPASNCSEPVRYSGTVPLSAIGAP